MCLMNWPAFKAEANDKDMGDWKVISRDDGSKQWAYKGYALYTYSGDKEPGDIEGNGMGEWQGKRNGFRAFYTKEVFGRRGG